MLANRIGSDKPRGSIQVRKICLTNAGVNIRPIPSYLSSSALHGPHGLRHDCTWLCRKTYSEKLTIQLSLVMQQYMGSVYKCGY